MTSKFKMKQNLYVVLNSFFVDFRNNVVPLTNSIYILHKMIQNGEAKFIATLLVRT